MKNTKILATLFKTLVCVGSIAAITLFFFDFVNVGEYALTGFESAFSSKQTVGGQEVNTFKSAWYMFAFLLNALTLVFAATNFKVKGAKYASFGFSIAAFVNMCVIYFANPITFDLHIINANVFKNTIKITISFLIFIINTLPI